MASCSPPVVAPASTRPALVEAGADARRRRWWRSRTAQPRSQGCDRVIAAAGRIRRRSARRFARPAPRSRHRPGHAGDGDEGHGQQHRLRARARARAAAPRDWILVQPADMPWLAAARSGRSPLPRHPTTPSWSRHWRRSRGRGGRRADAGGERRPSGAIHRRACCPSWLDWPAIAGRETCFAAIRCVATSSTIRESSAISTIRDLGDTDAGTPDERCAPAPTADAAPDPSPMRIDPLHHPPLRSARPPVRGLAAHRRPDPRRPAPAPAGLDSGQLHGPRIRPPPRGVSRRGGGRPSASARLTRTRWRTAACRRRARPLQLRYRVYAWDLSVRAAHLDASHGFFNGTSVFLAVAGRERGAVQRRHPAAGGRCVRALARRHHAAGCDGRRREAPVASARYRSRRLRRADRSSGGDGRVRAAARSMSAAAATRSPSPAAPTSTSTGWRATSKPICEEQIALFEPTRRRGRRSIATSS